MDQPVEPVSPNPTPVASPVSSAALPSLTSLLKEAWELFKQRLWILVGVAIVPVIVIMLISIMLGGSAAVGVGFGARSLFNGNTGGAFLFSGGVAVGILGIALLLYIAGLMQAALINAISSSEVIGVKESYKRSMPRAWGMLWATILVSVITGLGFLLLIIPGIIFAVWYLFTYYALITEQLSAGDAMKRSKHLVEGRWWHVFGRIFGLVVIVIIASWIIGLIAQGLRAPWLLFIYNLIVGLGLGLFFQCYIYRLFAHLKLTRS